jgi:hypothetical protein
MKHLYLTIALLLSSLATIAAINTSTAPIGQIPPPDCIPQDCDSKARK